MVPARVTDKFWPVPKKSVKKNNKNLWKWKTRMWMTLRHSVSWWMKWNRKTLLCWPSPLQLEHLLFSWTPYRCGYCATGSDGRWENLTNEKKYFNGKKFFRSQFWIIPHYASPFKVSPRIVVHAPIHETETRFRTQKFPSPFQFEKSSSYDNLIISFVSLLMLFKMLKSDEMFFIQKIVNM